MGEAGREGKGFESKALNDKSQGDATRRVLENDPI